MSEQVSGLMDNTLKGMRGFVDANSVVGDPITTPDGTMIIPVSKVSFGFGGGGSDFATSKPQNVFGGGTGGGMTLSPVAFLIIKDGNVKLLQINKNQTAVDKAVDLVPEMVDKISGFVKKDRGEPEAPGTAAAPEVASV